MQVKVIAESDTVTSDTEKGCSYEDIGDNKSDLEDRVIGHDIKSLQCCIGEYVKV